jgi:hypothetical protein
MKKHLGSALVALAAISIAMPATAQTRNEDKGASQYAPGQNKEPGQSARDQAPGHASGAAKDAAPGQQMKNENSSGTSSGSSSSDGTSTGTGTSSGSSGNAGSSGRSR